MSNFQSGNGAFTYTPNGGFTGVDQFTYSATDPEGSGVATVLLLVGSGVSPFPVVWEDMAVTLDRNDGVLSWITSSELNASHFEVERSVDARMFEAVGMVKAAGNTSVATSYEFRDGGVRDLGTAKAYYRLRQVDMDGQFSYSPTLELSLDAEFGLYLDLMPVPASSYVEMRWDATDSSSTVYLLNELGQVLRTASLPAGVEGLRWELSTLNEGLYFLQLQSQGRMVSKSLLIRR